ncbi:MAG: ATP-binding protein [Acidobacteriota bacterium]|jgi:predicted AAA+ superfamily ATPase|nr:ATP-binding protein [Acidobacteriota bacterium]
MQKAIERPDYLMRLAGWKDKSDVVKIITGIRRCGKSTLFKLYQRYLQKNGVSGKRILDINFEDAANEKFLDWRVLHNHIKENCVGDTMNYVFLDEIQSVPEFQKAVNSLRLAENIDLYLTGSNSRMLSGEFATLLSGRYVEIHMLPLSFKEYVSAYPYNAAPDKMFGDYLRNSSFPYTVQLTAESNSLLNKKNGWDNEQIQMFLRGVYNTIVLKDIVERRKVANVSRLESVIKFMFDNIGSEMSLRNIQNTMKSGGRDIQLPTIENYLSGLLDAFVLYKVGRYDIKGKKHLQTNAKYYLSDIGLRYLLLGREGDMGRILENAVFLELFRRGYMIHTGKINRSEVDFVAVKDGYTEYYQVSHDIGSKETFQREIASLNMISDHNPKYILTRDYPLESLHDGIKIVNVLEWMTY